MKKCSRIDRANLVNLKTMCIFVTKCILDFSGQEKVPNGKKEEKLDCDSLERLLPVPRVGAQQEKG